MLLEEQHSQQQNQQHQQNRHEQWRQQVKWKQRLPLTTNVVSSPVLILATLSSHSRVATSCDMSSSVKAPPPASPAVCTHRTIQKLLLFLLFLAVANCSWARQNRMVDTLEEEAHQVNQSTFRERVKALPLLRTKATSAENVEERALHRKTERRSRSCCTTQNSKP